MKHNATKILVFSAILAAFSAVTQLIHIGYQSPAWGMWIDIVAVSWFVGYFLFGFKPALTISLVGAIIITLFAPDTWLGATMKWSATVPVIVALFAYLKITKKHLRDYQNVSHLILPVIAGIVIRCAIVIPVNYYFAIPIWTGMTPTEAIAAIPWYAIAGFNVVQTIVDIALAWLLVFVFRLSTYAGWEKNEEE